MGGTTARATGPMAPMTQDQKRAGRSRIDQRQYRMGVCQKRGARPDILAAVDGGSEDVERGSYERWCEKYLLVLLGLGGCGCRTLYLLASRAVFSSASIAATLSSGEVREVRPVSLGSIGQSRLCKDLARLTARLRQMLHHGPLSELA